MTVIVPFNWPIAILGAALPHALLAGNTAIVKPPPSAPLATTRVVQRVAEKLPPGVLNVVTGRDAQMAGLIQNPDVAKVCFTGSVNGGKRIMAMAAHDAHPGDARARRQRRGDRSCPTRSSTTTHLDRLFAAIYDTTGQICMNAKRVFVHRSRMDELVAGPVRRGWSKAKLGHGLDEGTTMGPLHQPAQKAFVEEIIQEAKDAGAEVREFGELPGGDLAGGQLPAAGDRRRPRPLAPRRDAGAVRPGDPGDPVRRRGRGGPAGERHLGRPLRLRLDRRSRGRPARRRRS